MKIPRLQLLLVVTLLSSACGRADDEPTPLLNAQILGTITVDAEIDSLRDYSGFELLISSTLEPGISGDTLYYAVTDTDGAFEGEATFATSGLYTMLISRRDEPLAYSDLVLADGDTVHFEAEFPDVEQSASVQSYENDLYRSYLRLQTGVNRVFQFAQAGHISSDTLDAEVLKWSDMLWEFHEDHPQTFAGRQAAASSIRLLEDWQIDLMLERLDSAVRSDPSFIPLASQIGVRHHAQRDGMDAGLAYLDSLAARGPGERIDMQLKMNRVKMLYDSARVDRSRQELEEFRERFSGNQVADFWIERFEYDLERLAPGADMPAFVIEDLDGQSITNSSLSGQPYILEFTRLDNLLYQDQFDRNVAIHHIYKNYGVDFITIPFDASEIVIDAFFEERAQLWPVALPGTFDRDELIERFNINVIPTRILVDESGRVVRKYEGTEYNDIISGLRHVINREPIQEDEPL